MSLIVFVKAIFDNYLNNIYPIVSSLHLVCYCLGKYLMYALPSNKKNAKIPENFNYTRIVLPWKQNCAFKSRNLIRLRVGVRMQNC